MPGSLVCPMLVGPTGERSLAGWHRTGSNALLGAWQGHCLYVCAFLLAMLSFISMGNPRQNGTTGLRAIDGWSV